MRLSDASLHRAQAVLPAYDRAQVTPGIVHLGVGNFHRAHQAVYVDDSLAADPSWGIVGVSLRRGDMARALTPQDGLYGVGVRDGSGLYPRVIGSLLQVLHTSPQQVIARLADPAIRLVTLTITEKGYCHDPATGQLDAQHPDIRADLATPSAPITAPGLLVAALAVRHAAGLAPFTVLSCDNLPANGRVLARILGQMAALQSDDLAQWIDRHLVSPSSMVDRIVPATTDSDRQDMARQLTLHDAWPVMTEPFSQWVIEDRFALGRPDLPGAELVSDVTPFETMKLRMLNGAHSTLAYLGQLMGYKTVADAMGDPRLVDLIQTMWREEIAPTLALPQAQLRDYAARLTSRFINPALHHKTAQIAMDGSQKVPQRLLGTIGDRRRAGAAHDRLTLGVAAWLAFIAQADDLADPLADAILQCRQATLPGIRAFALAMMDRRDVFGDLSDDTAFRDKVALVTARLVEKGAACVV